MKKSKQEGIFVLRKKKYWYGGKDEREGRWE